MGTRPGGIWRIEADLDSFTDLEDLGILDVFRAEHGYGDIATEGMSLAGRGFDHFFLRKNCTPRLDDTSLKNSSVVNTHRF